MLDTIGVSEQSVTNVNISLGSTFVTINETVDKICCLTGDCQVDESSVHDGLDSPLLESANAWKSLIKHDMTNLNDTFAKLTELDLDLAVNTFGQVTGMSGV